MVNKIYTLILVLLFALPVAAQTPKVMIEHQVEGPGTIEVPIQFEHFSQDVQALTLKIGYDNEVLTFIELQPDIDPDGLWFSNAVGGELTIAYVGFEEINISGQSINMVFAYNGFSSPLDFLPGSEFETATGTIPPSAITFVNGSVSLDPDAALGTVALGTLDDVEIEAEVLMPIYAGGDGLTEVGAFSLKVNYDSSRLLYTTNILNVHPSIAAGELFVNQLPGQISISWFGMPVDLSELTKLLDMQFVFQGGGNTMLDFAAGSEMLDGEGEPLAVLFEGGAVNQFMPEGIELSIATKEATPGELVQVPITAAGLDGFELGSLIWRIQYDIQKTPYVQATGLQLGADDNFEVNQTASGELTITAFNVDGIVFDDGDVLMLEFMYMGGGNAPITFNPGSQTSGLDGVPVSVSYINGGIGPKPAGPTDAVAVIGKVNTLLDGCDSEVVHVPVRIDNLDVVLGGMTMQIGFTPGVLSFVEIIFAEGQEDLEDAISIENTANTITLGGFDAWGITEGGKLFDLVFTYNGGNSPIEFLPGTTFQDLAGEDLPVALVDGGVTAMDLDVDLISEFDLIKTITGTPSLVPFHVEYGDLATINPDILIDTRIIVEGGFPEGAVIENVIFNGMLFEPANGDVGGMDELLLSDLFGAEPGSLSELHMTEDHWIFILSGIDEAVSFLVHLDVFAYMGDCNQVVADAHVELHFNDAQLSLDIEEAAVCFDEELEVVATIEYPEIINLLDAVAADALIAVEPAINAGSVINWDYNGVTSGQFVADEAMSTIYLSEIVGSQSPLSGHNALTDVWTFHLGGVDFGEYTFAVHALAQLFETDYIYAAEEEEFEFWIEPTLEVELSEELVCFDGYFEIHIQGVDGTGPWTLEYVITGPDGDEFETGTLTGMEGVIEVDLDGQYAPGIWTFEITHIEDENCAAVDFEHIYTIEVIGEPGVTTGDYHLATENYQVEGGDPGTSYFWNAIWQDGDTFMTGDGQMVHGGLQVNIVDDVVEISACDFEQVFNSPAGAPAAGLQLVIDNAPEGTSHYGYIANIDDLNCLYPAGTGTPANIEDGQFTVVLNFIQWEGASNYLGPREGATDNLVILDEDGFVLEVREITFTTTELPEPAVLFAFNGVPVSTDEALEYCFNEEVEVTLHEILSGTGPITLHYVLNDDDPVEWTGEAGDVIFEAGLLPVGPHTLKLVHLEDANACHAQDVEDIYALTIEIHPEPAVLFAFNEQVVATDEVLYFLDNEEVTVYLHEVLAGTGTITLHWVLNDDDPVEWSGLEGEVIFGPVELPVGTHSVTVTHLADSNCEAVNPEEIYKLTVIVEQSIVDVATLAELRTMPADGTVYRYTGDAVIVAMDGFRNRKFIQDETAAILIDDQPGVITTTYELYDVISGVVGKINIWNQMVRFQPEENTEPATENTPVEPIVFALDEVTSDDQAKLIHFENVSFVGVDEGDTFANGTNYDITDGENFFELRVDFWNIPGITGEQIPLGPVNLTGVMVQFQDSYQIVPRMADDIEEILFTITFDVTNVHGEPVDDAVIALNGVENDPGDYVFPDLVPGTYSYVIDLFCYMDSAGVVTLTHTDVTEMVTLDNMMGDANGDGVVNVQDVMLIVDFFMGGQPSPFCMVNADVNNDEVINVQDVMLTVDIFMSSKSILRPGIILETPLKEKGSEYYYQLFKDRFQY